MNCFMTPLLIPISMIVGAAFGVSQVGGSIAEVAEVFSEITTFLKAEEFMIFSIVLIGAAMMALVFFLSSSCTAISREGSQFNILKSYPIAMEKQLLGKTFVNLFIFSIFTLIAATIAAILFNFLYQNVVMAIVLFILIIVISEIVVFSSTLTTIAIDGIKPKLIWTTEQEAVKQNYFVLITLVIGIALLVIIGFSFAFLPFISLINGCIIIIGYLAFLPFSWFFYKKSITALCQKDI
ncbi:MAG: hypothetical protein ACK5G7_02170 [Erysipelotrichaceae bacterium]